MAHGLPHRNRQAVAATEADEVDLAQGLRAARDVPDGEAQQPAMADTGRTRDCLSELIRRRPPLLHGRGEDPAGWPRRVERRRGAQQRVGKGFDRRRTSSSYRRGTVQVQSNWHRTSRADPGPGRRQKVDRIPFPAAQAQHLGSRERGKDGLWTGVDLGDPPALIWAERAVVQDDCETGPPPTSRRKLRLELRATHALGVQRASSSDEAIAGPRAHRRIVHRWSASPPASRSRCGQRPGTSRSCADARAVCRVSAQDREEAAQAACHRNDSMSRSTRWASSSSWSGATTNSASSASG
jgi:hypothetical protein